MPDHVVAQLSAYIEIVAECSQERERGRGREGERERGRAWVAMLAIKKGIAQPKQHLFLYWQHSMAELPSWSIFWDFNTKQKIKQDK